MIKKKNQLLINKRNNGKRLDLIKQKVQKKSTPDYFKRDKLKDGKGKRIKASLWILYLFHILDFDVEEFQKKRNRRIKSLKRPQD